MRGTFLKVRTVPTKTQVRLLCVSDWLSSPEVSLGVFLVFVCARGCAPFAVLGHFHFPLLSWDMHYTGSAGVVAVQVAGALPQTLVVQKRHHKLCRTAFTDTAADSLNKSVIFIGIVGKLEKKRIFQVTETGIKNENEKNQKIRAFQLVHLMQT